MRRALAHAWPYLVRYRRGLIVGLVAAVVLEAVAATVPVLTSRGVDAVAAAAPARVVVMLAASVLGIVAVKAALLFTARLTFMGASRDVEHDMRQDLFAHLLTLPPEYYRTTRVGDVMALATSDLNAVRMMLGPGLFNCVAAAAAFVPAAVVMALADWRLTLVALLPAPCAMWLLARLGHHVHDRFEAIQRAYSDMSSRVQEQVSGMRVIRAFAREGVELERFGVADAEYVRLNLRLARVSSLLAPTSQLVMGVSSLLVLWVGGERVLGGQLSAGNYVMFSTYIALLARPTVTMGRVINMLQRGAASMDRLQALQQVPSACQGRGTLAPSPDDCRGDVEIDEVTVAGVGRPALDRVTLRVRGGSMLAIVGPTGAGKSAVASLLPRLLDPAAGCVRLDGRDLRDYPLADVRRRVAVVPQETFLFDGTLAENLAFGVPDLVADDRRLREAADIAGLGPDLAAMPDGLDTVVGERGLSLSGGQKQRVAIARALLCAPAVLVLDDALSSVDTITEARILDALRRMATHSTIVLITHRAATARHADQIAVLESGVVTELGGHEALVGGDGHYARLWQEQIIDEAVDRA